MSKITSIKAIQVLDSRGLPTVACRITLDNSLTAGVMVPSGASTGAKEAIELRDGLDAYMGKGVLKAVSNINEIISPILIGLNPLDQEKIDRQLIKLDGTEDKSYIGANAILAVSLAVCRVAAKDIDKSLHKYFADIFKDITGNSVGPSIPIPMLNILNGGEHADNNIDIQEFMIIPKGAKDFKQAMRWSSEVYWSLKTILKEQSLSSAVGDEGGFAPNLKSNEEAIKLILEAIKKSNLEPGKDIFLALDCAASEFYEDGIYKLAGEEKSLDSESFASYLEYLVDNYPIISIEDGMDEDDFEGWKVLTEKIGSKCQLVGDDLFVTNSKRLKKGIDNKCANSILIKPNQIGTLSETLEVISLAKKANFNTIVSHRSGDTEDTFIADLSVATMSSQIKTGSLARSERVAKYNRLLRIEEELGNQVKMAKI